MHREQREWCESIKEMFPERFDTVRVLDIGSLDVNGTNRYLFKNSYYVGVDVVRGPGVDIVCPAHEVSGEKYDVVLSTNSLEHDMFWFLTLPNMMRMTESGGLMFFSCGYSQRQHGTIIAKPRDSGTTRLTGDWKNYYRNLKLLDIYSVMNPERHFRSFMAGVSGRDLRFWGIRK